MVLSANNCNDDSIIINGENFPFLIRIDLGNNKIKSMEIFKKWSCQKVIDFNLSDNEIKNVEYLPAFINVERLNLTNNCISSL